MSTTRRTSGRAFTSLPLRGHFSESVWDIVRRIPRGKVMTYGDLAAATRRPTGITVRHFKAAGPRWVGQAMARCPADVPWHRVVNAKGKVSRRSRGDDHVIQRALLQEEGVPFGKRDRIDLHRYRWTPRPHARRRRKAPRLR